MSSRISRVLILYTGGTFGMDANLKVPKLSPQLLKKRFLKQVPELQKIAHCDVKIILNLDSAHISPKEWVLFAETIQSSWNNYDGIVILHGTDTLSYTASALSFLLRPCLKPIVITGAQLPLSAIWTDARNNLLSAVEIAAHGPRNLVTQVNVFFADKLFQGNRVRKTSAYDFAAFESPYYPPLAIVGTQIHYAQKSDLPALRPLSRFPSETLKLKPTFSSKVAFFYVSPGFPFHTLTESYLMTLDGIVLFVFLSGTAPTQDHHFLQFLDRAKKMNIPITLTTSGKSQAYNHRQQPVPYEAGKELYSAGCFWSGSMTPECTYVRTSLILGQGLGGLGIKNFSKLWNSNFCNEGISL
jgi:L-asparaginase